MQRGDIFKFKEKKKFENHPFAILGIEQGIVHGVAITHSPDYGNIMLKECFFITSDDRGKPYEVMWDNSKYVNQRLDKTEAINLSDKKGQLSEDGIKFIEDNLPVGDAQFVKNLRQLIRN